MGQQSIEIVKNHLAEDIIIVTFTKADGSERVMKCTTNPEFVPEEHTPKGDSTRALSDEVCRVFDVENQAWRSFRWDSVLEVTLGE